ncbi:MAG: FAD-binding protein [Longimicrobiales bacterium]|nr:FAD-binding protein [Longimicrobiales bacterium]
MADAKVAPGDPALERALRTAIKGDVSFDAFTRGLYSTDASHYQIEPLGVVFPETTADVQAILEIARERDVPVLPRGGGTSQCGQTIGRAVILDTSRHLRHISDLEFMQLGPDRGDNPQHICVEPGITLDTLNQSLEATGLWFPVDPSTGSRATLGGMAGNNSAGARSLQYGMMVDNVSAVEVILADGRTFWVGEGGTEGSDMPSELAVLRALHTREAKEIAARAPRTMRNVAGYNLERLDPAAENIARLLIGSEGTLGFFSELRLRLAKQPTARVLGICHFPTLVTALDAVQHLVQIEPSAVELVDSNVLRLAAERPEFRDTMSTFVRGEPGALLLVEFATTEEGAESTFLIPKLTELATLLGDLGFPDSVESAITPEGQGAVWALRKAGLNIVMSMAGPRKPISFIEDCAVPLEHLAAYAEQVSEIFARHDTDGTWYAHASVGCLHVRPALNLRDPDDVALVRQIANETHEVVRTFGGTHSGEHGDGILRSEFLETMLGRRMTEAFREVKETFDPNGMMNPGKIVDPPRMDDRSLFRYPPGYAAKELPVVLDWSAKGGLLSAVESCNNNGACRKFEAGVMCPSFRATRDERHSTRGRANALRLALTNQLGPEGLDSPEMAEAMSLCISCKGCKRECPTGVDMARMKLEWQHRRNARVGISARDRALASLPRLAPRIHRLGPLLNLGGRGPFKRLVGLAAKRPLPRWHRRPWLDGELGSGEKVHAGEAGHTPDVAVFVDTFSRWFEPEIPRAASAVLEAGCFKATTLKAPEGERPLCCGRTYLSSGMLDEARIEGERLLAAALPLAEAGVPIVGLEPSCLYTLRDEIPALIPGAASDAVAAKAGLLEEFLSEQWSAGRELPLGESTESDIALVHGHCHQKAFGGTAATITMLEKIPGLDVRKLDTGCCGMAGAFGYHAEHYDMSMQMGREGLFGELDRWTDHARLVADGTSCRAQIADGTTRTADHIAVVLAEALVSSDQD